MAESRHDKHLSKRLAWLLRHGAVEHGFQLVDGCYLNVDEILAHRQFRDVTIADIRRVVENSSKRRYELREDASGRLQIRAVQGHTMEVDGLDLVEITADSCDQYPLVLHGTYMQHWPSIAARGLSRMARLHIHFASGERDRSGGAISSQRRSAEVLIRVDLARALADGFKFYVARNDVILCPGDETGTLPTAYFKEVWKLKPYRLLIFADGQPVE